MDNGGFVKLKRSFFDTDIWLDAHSLSIREAYIDLLGAVRFDASDLIYKRVGGGEVTYGKGQFVASIRFLAKRWGCGEKLVRSYLDRMKRANLIRVDNTQGVNVITVILDEDEKRLSDTPSDTASDTPLDTDKEQLITQLQELTTQLRTHLWTQGRTHLEKSGHTLDTNNKNDKNIKEKPTSNEVGKKKDALSFSDRPIERRKDDFMNELAAYVAEYGRETLRSFFDYWSEESRGGVPRMRWEMEKTWNTASRLRTWHRRESEKRPTYGNARNDKGPRFTDEEIRRAVEAGCAIADYDEQRRKERT